VQTSRRQHGSLRERKRAAARAAVADAAIRLFAERGYDAVSIAEICQAAEVAPRSFFRYFQAKEDVLLEPFRQLSDRVLRSIATAPAGLDDRETLERALRATAEHVLAEWDALVDYFDVMEQTTSVKTSPSVQLADRERAIAEELQRRRGAPAPPDWPTRLLIARGTAAYRVWLDEVRTTTVEDPLRLFDAIFSARG
jgi:AcrR family transcriptional regulator